MYDHSFANCTASWSGIDVKASMDSGQPIGITRTVARNTFKATGSGKLIKIRQTDESGLVTCTLDYSSPGYTLLMAQLELETIAPFILYDGNTKRRWYYLNSVLVTVPDLTMGIDTGPFSWQWMYEKADYQPGAASNLNLNIIGS